MQPRLTNTKVGEAGEVSKAVECTWMRGVVQTAQPGGVECAVRIGETVRPWPGAAPGGAAPAIGYRGSPRALAGSCAVSCGRGPRMVYGN